MRDDYHRNLTIGVLQHYASLCAQAGRECRFASVEFPWNAGANGVGDALCKAAQLAGARNLVLGFRGLSTAERLAMGSVSSRCVLTCDMTVTVAKPRSLAAASSSSSTTS
jgi:hypothetical protein